MDRLALYLFMLWFMLNVWNGAGDQLYASSYKSEDLSYASALYREVSKKHFCEALQCMEFEEDSHDRQVLNKLIDDFEAVLDGLDIKGIPRPELVYIHPDNMGNRKLHSASARPRDGYTSLKEGHFFEMMYRELLSVITEYDDQALVSDRVGYLTLHLNGVSHAQKFNTLDFDLMELPPVLIQDEDSQVQPEQIENLLNGVLGDRFGFRYSDSEHQMRIWGKKSDSTSSLLDLGGSSSFFNWNSNGISVERKFNKIIFMSYKAPRHIPYSQLLIELLWEIYGYYEIGFVASARPSILIDERRVKVYSASQQRTSKPKPLISANMNEIMKIFTSQPYSLRKPEHMISPELWSLFYFLEAYLHYYLAQNSISSARKGLFFESSVARNFMNQFKQTPLWRDYESDIRALMNKTQNAREAEKIHYNMTHQTGVFMQIISSEYENSSASLVLSLEKDFIEFYKNGTPYQRILESLGVTDMKAFDEFFDSLTSSHLWAEDMARDLLEWLTRFKGRDFAEVLAHFSNEIEDRKRIYNQKRQIMIQNKAVPKYVEYYRDEMIVRYLDLLGLTPKIYEQYLLRNLSDVEKSRCLMVLTYEEDLFEYYQISFFSGDPQSVSVLCGRILNLRKEARRRH